MSRPGTVLRILKDTLGDTGSPAPLEGGCDPFAVLVGTVISLRTRDAVTREVTPAVLRRAPDPVKMEGMPLPELEGLLRPAGFYRTKARQLQETARILNRDHGGAVPKSREALTALPGVGGKTAAFVLGVAFGVSAICVDVHVHRVANRLGLVRTRTPEETEKALMALYPPGEWIGLNSRFVRFGQRICLPRRPRCPACPLRGECLHARP